MYHQVLQVLILLLLIDRGGLTEKEIPGHGSRIYEGGLSLLAGDEFLILFLQAMYG